MSPAARRRVLRSGSSTIIFAASAVVAVLLLGDAVIRAGVVTGLLLAPWVLLVLWLIYVVTFVSHVSTDAAGIRVQNLLRVTDVPWSHVTDVEMRWQLRLHLDSGDVLTSFGGPSEGRAPARRRTDAARPAASTADRQVGWIHDQWEAALRDGDGHGDVRRSWDVWALVALGVLVVWAVIAVLISGGPS